MPYDSIQLNTETNPQSKLSRKRTIGKEMLPKNYGTLGKAIKVYTIKKQDVVGS